VHQVGDQTKVNILLIVLEKILVVHIR